MRTGVPVRARVMAFERAIPPVGHNVRIPSNPDASPSHEVALHLPFRQRFKKSLDMAHGELAKQIADGVLYGEAFDPQ